MWRLRRRRVMYQGRIVRLDLDDLEYRGRKFARENLVHPGAVAVVPVLPDGRVVLIRQFRYAAQQRLLEIPAGTLEPGERPLACARRELIEETGYRARRLRLLGWIYPVPGYSTERIMLYVATGLTSCAQALEPDEQLSIHPMRVPDVVRLLRRGRIIDAKTAVGLFHYLWYNKYLC